MPKPHVIVTGGESDLGAVTARRFTDAGYRVTVMGRTSKETDAVADEIGGRSVRVDVGDPASVEAAFMAAGPADVLINTTGLFKKSKLVGTNVRTWEEILKVNLTGAYLCSLKVLPYMIRKGQGRIINVVGIAGLLGFDGMVAYCASKHGLIGFSRALAVELANDGITVNSVCPGAPDTATVRDSFQLLSASARTLHDSLKSLMLDWPTEGESVDPQQVAAVIEYLARPEANDISGQALALPGQNWTDSTE